MPFEQLSNDKLDVTLEGTQDKIDMLSEYAAMDWYIDTIKVTREPGRDDVLQLTIIPVEMEQ